MKKTLALVLSLAMLFTLCVPAFAIDKTMTQDTDKTVADNIQATVTTAIPAEIISKGGYFSLSFPADTPITWGTTADTSTPLNCKVYTNLMNGSTLTVSVAAASDSVVLGENVMQNPTKSAKIPFALGTATATLASFVNPTSYNWIPTVDVTKASWDNAPIGNDYTAHLTFSANVNLVP